MSHRRLLRLVATVLALLAVVLVVPTRHLTAVGPAAPVLGVASHSPEPAVATAAACCVDCPGHGFGRVGDATSRPPAAMRQTPPRPVDDPNRSSGAPSAPLRPPRDRPA